jgi:phytoene dehydrogenase-like protein
VSRFDTLVIGAGFSGLAAGIRLALAGQRVAVLERHYLWGGLNSFYKRGGRLFDSGLHALTNFVPKGTRGTPLARVLRQLRIGWDELALREQRHSEIVVGGERVRFSNDFGLLASEVERLRPERAGAFRALAEEIRGAPLELEEQRPASARAELDRRLGDPFLTDLLLLPCCYYGSAQEHDVEWDQFQILFRSIFLEGLSLPSGGVRPLLRLFTERLEAAGGELHTKSEVIRILEHDGRAAGVELADGRQLAAETVLSSAGYVETLRLCGRAADLPPGAHGQLSFVETISVLDRWPHLLARPGRPMDAGVIFFSTAPRLRYARPSAPCDLESGVISMPTNFQGTPPDHEGLFRVTVLADHAAWIDQPAERYRAEKARWSEAALAASEAFCAPVRPHEVFRDAFTPRTIRHFTSHEQGAIYGSPLKQKSGQTPLPGLYLIGTDQGFLGIVGACVSGIAMANLHALKRAGAADPSA